MFQKSYISYRRQIFRSTTTIKYYESFPAETQINTEVILSLLNIQ